MGSIHYQKWVVYYCYTHITVKLRNFDGQFAGLDRLHQTPDIWNPPALTLWIRAGFAMVPSWFTVFHMKKNGEEEKHLKKIEDIVQHPCKLSLLMIVTVS